jgi:flagellar motor switch protein FliM
MDPKEILSDEESQALRDADAQTEGTEAPAREGQVRELHADHWERIVADRVPALESISDATRSRLLPNQPALTAGVLMRGNCPCRPVSTCC